MFPKTREGGRAGGSTNRMDGSPTPKAGSPTADPMGGAADPMGGSADDFVVRVHRLMGGWSCGSCHWGHVVAGHKGP